MCNLSELKQKGRLYRNEGSKPRHHFDFFSRTKFESLKCSIFQSNLKLNARTLEPHGAFGSNHQPHINYWKFEVSDFERMLKILSLLILERSVEVKPQLMQMSGWKMSPIHLGDSVCMKRSLSHWAKCYVHLRLSSSSRFFGTKKYFFGKVTSKQQRVYLLPMLSSWHEILAAPKLG